MLFHVEMVQYVEELGEEVVQVEAREMMEMVVVMMVMMIRLNLKSKLMRWKTK